MGKGNKENTFHRDGRLSRRHREYGIPMTDLDLIILSFNHAEPLAVIEFKNERSERKELSHPTILAVMRMCDAADLYYFLIRYTLDLSKYKITGVNQKANDHLAMIFTNIGDDRIKTVELNEQDYVEFLYGICDVPVPEKIKALFSQTTIEFEYD